MTDSSHPYRLFWTRLGLLAATILPLSHTGVWAEPILSEVQALAPAATQTATVDRWQAEPPSGAEAQLIHQVTVEAVAPAGPAKALPPVMNLEPETGLLPGPTSVAEVMRSVAPIAEEISPRYQSLFTTSAKLPSIEQPQVPANESIYKVPLVVTPKVEGHMRFFHTAIRDRFEQWLTRFSRYKKQVEDIFTEFDLPRDLIFLSLVESGFNPHAYSRARATGPWQFMQGTAKHYGLRVDGYVDERRDPIKSTVAAAQYLRDLYDMFGTWPLAMAAYNAGEGKVLRALQKTQADTFWEIAETKHLKRETKEYVPRFMAATIIAKDPDQYGFSAVDAAPHEFEEVIVRRSVHLRDVAAVVGVPYEELEHLNPELRRYITPPGEEYHLKVPAGSSTMIESLLDQVKTWKGPLPSPKRGQVSGGWYRVRVGDTLQSIGKRFRLSVSELRARNHLANRHILRPGERLRVGH